MRAGSAGSNTSGEVDGVARAAQFLAQLLADLGPVEPDRAGIGLGEADRVGRRRKPVPAPIPRRFRGGAAGSASAPRYPRGSSSSWSAPPSSRSPTVGAAVSTCSSSIRLALETRPHRRCDGHCSRRRVRRCQPLLADHHLVAPRPVGQRLAHVPGRLGEQRRHARCDRRARRASGPSP